MFLNGIMSVGGKALRDQKKKDSKALFLIHQCADADVFEKIVEFKTVKAAWDALATTYADDDHLKKVNLNTLH